MSAFGTNSSKHPCGFAHAEGRNCSEIVIGGTGFKDVLTSRRTDSDLVWALQSWTPSPSFSRGALRPDQIVELVKKSRKLSEAIQLESQTAGVPVAEVEERVSSLLSEMSHNQGMGTVRFFAVVLSKLVRQIFCHVYVNRSGVERVREVLTRAPTVFLPSHRSYADFLVISFLCYSYHLPLPVIAAAMGEFLGSDLLDIFFAF
jgi:glycerone phosphate O-acyltransferase